MKQMKHHALFMYTLELKLMVLRSNADSRIIEVEARIKYLKNVFLY
ncbi:MAG: hypothetical protein IJW01_08085 [Paludibacteraceae bacterium]|nr:hypothetical protein [Paludibacteraceae bacterium]